MNKVKRKLALFHNLKTISYLLGFPLLIVVVMMGSMQFMTGDAFAKTAWYGVYAIAAIWALVTILQIGFSIFVKDFKIRTLIAMVLSVSLLLGGALYFDFYAKKVITQTQEDYKDKGISIEDFEHQINWYVTMTTGKTSMTKQLNNSIANFTNTYNIKYSSKNYGKKNTDLSEIIYNKEEDAYYSQNGMLADGYKFGVKKALDILITYHEVQALYKAKDKDADTELAAAIAALESDSASAWNTYKQTPEYIAAYGPNGEAYKYMLSVERLDLILGAIGRELESEVSGIAGLLSAINMNEYADLLDYVNENLTTARIVDIINEMNLFDEAITEDTLMDLLKGFSFYQSPKTKPIFEFLEDQNLKDYAYADYYATVHGAKIGSVLIGENIGEVTMDNSGTPAINGYDLQQLYELEASLSYKPMLYPLMAARRYAYMLAAIVALSYLLAYHFGQKQKEYFESEMGGK